MSDPPIEEAAPRRIRCAICGTRVRESDETTACGDCAQRYHAACWSAIRGCATYGCKKAAVAQKAPPPKAVGAGWGDEKACPACQSDIPSSLLVCRSCKATFPWADPMTPGEYEDWKADQLALSKERRVLTFLFVASLTVVASPLAGPSGAIYAWTKRRRMVGTDGVYAAMGYGSALLGVAYVVLVLAFGR